MKINHKPFNSVKTAPWRATYVLKPDMDLLRESMMDFGWMSPIVVRAHDSTIIDGTHRWVIAGEKDFQRIHGTEIPIVFVECDEIDAMLMHVRLNRARGQIFAKPFSRLLKKVILSDKYSVEDVSRILIMSPDEVDLMLAGGLLKQRKVPQHQYSRAWVPVEAPAASEIEHISLERPPNLDR